MHEQEQEHRSEYARNLGEVQAETNIQIEIEGSTREVARDRLRLNVFDAQLRCTLVQTKIDQRSEYPNLMHA